MNLSFFGVQKLNRLAERMKRGDEEAARAMYEELADKVFGFCMTRVGEKATAEDLTQDIFMKLVTRIETFDAREGNFVSWFWQIARHTVIDYWRSKRSETAPFSSFEESEVEAMVSTGGPREEEARIAVRDIREFMKTLLEEEQELFELRLIAGLSYREIAKMTQKSEGALRVAVSRLREKVRYHIEL